ncbi:MAG: pyrimidine 5'-nucleotidase [Alphaproteobacteria bacterium]|jgi:putative hydrolase of the HAD superfamily|nr:pyrimidine 5'-nucleotidase [Alphaproteobacteria bacterium]
MPESTDPNLRDIAVWIFDLDNTLYPAGCGLGAQLGRRMGEFVAKYLDLPLDQARVVQKRYFHDHGTTLRGMMLEHDLEPREYLDYVHDLDLSGIPMDDRLGPALDALPGRKLVFTNATTKHAQRVVRHLGIDHHFDGFFDIVDAGFVPKPNQQPYDVVLARHDIDPTRAVMVEDIAQNLMPAAGLGMATVWVRGGRDLTLAADQIRHVHHIADDLPGWLLGIVGGNMGT